MRLFKQRFTTFGAHATLILAVALSSVPFYWAFQNSIKFTRDTITRVPKLWGFSVTADPYRKFWFDNEEQSMGQVLLFFLGLTAVIVAILALRRLVCLLYTSPSPRDPE